MAQRGFTLVEILVAFVVVASVVGACFSAIATGLANERRAALAIARVLEARSLLDAVGRDGPLREGVFDGETSRGERWRLTVLPISRDLEPVRRRGGMTAYTASLVISAGGQPVLDLHALKLGPADDG